MYFENMFTEINFPLTTDLIAIYSMPATWYYVFDMKIQKYSFHSHKHISWWYIL